MIALVLLWRLRDLGARIGRFGGGAFAGWESAPLNSWKPLCRSKRIRITAIISRTVRSGPPCREWWGPRQRDRWTRGAGRRGWDLSERQGLIGGRYKRLYREAKIEADRARYLKKAIENYERGMTLDLNDYYPSSNLPALYLTWGRRGDTEGARGRHRRPHRLRPRHPAQGRRRVDAADAARPRLHRGQCPSDQRPVRSHRGRGPDGVEAGDNHP